MTLHQLKSKSINGKGSRSQKMINDHEAQKETSPLRKGRSKFKKLDLQKRVYRPYDQRLSEFHGFSPCYQQRACGFTLERLRVDVKEIGTYKLDLQGGHTLTFM